MAGSTPEQTALDAIQQTMATGHPKRSCPHCTDGHLSRVHLPAYLRPLRWVGLDVRKYECDRCRRRVTRRSREREPHS